jgi:hypothetical protein
MATYLTQAVASSKVNDNDNIYDHYMNLPNVYLRRHPAIFPGKPSDLVLLSFAKIDFGKLNWMYSGNCFHRFSFT